MRHAQVKIIGSPMNYYNVSLLEIRLLAAKDEVAHSEVCVKVCDVFAR